MTIASPGDEGEAAAKRRARAARLPACADIVDALGRIHRYRAHIHDLVTPTPGRVLFGPAVTISFFPSCSVLMDPETHTFGALLRQAVGVEPDGGRGKVLVLASNATATSPSAAAPSFPS